MNDQTAKADNGKLQLTLVPPELIEAVAVIRDFGNRKYGDPDNWKQVEPQRYWDAAVRHTVASWEDYKAIDQESGFPHLFHILTNIAFIISLEGMTNDIKRNCGNNQSTENGTSGEGVQNNGLRTVFYSVHH